MAGDRVVKAVLAALLCAAFALPALAIGEDVAAPYPCSGVTAWMTAYPDGTRLAWLRYVDF